MSEQKTRLDRHGLAYLWSYITSLLRGKADKSDVPTKVSQLTNDSGYITNADVPAPDMSQAQGILPIVNGGTGDWTVRGARENLQAHGYTYINRDSLYVDDDISDRHVFSILLNLLGKTHASAAVVLDSYVTSVLTEGAASAEFLGTVQFWRYIPENHIRNYRFWGVLTATNTFVYWDTVEYIATLTWGCSGYTVVNPGGDVTSVNGQTGAVVLDADDVGALPDTTTAADIGALPDTTTAADLGTVALADIPTDAYTLITNFGANVAKYNASSDANNLRCIRYGNGMKRIFGLFKTTASISGGDTICTVPTAFENPSPYSNNGGIQGWLSISGRGVNYIGRLTGEKIMLWSYSIPADNYLIDFWYF